MLRRLAIAGLTLVATAARRAARALSGEALRNPVKFTSQLFDQVPLALAMRDTTGRYLFINRTWERYFNARREEVVGRHVRERMTAAEADELLALDRAAIERGSGTTQTEDFNFRGRRLMQTRAVMADDAGNPLGILVATLETTEQHATNQRL